MALVSVSKGRRLTCLLLALFYLVASGSSLLSTGESSLGGKLEQILDRLDSLGAKQDELVDLVRANCLALRSTRSAPNEPNQSGILIGPDAGLERDLFHSSRLADNAIPTGNEQQKQPRGSSLADELQHQQTSQSVGLDRAKRQLLDLSQHYEVLLAGSLDSLGSLVREHLAAFRLGLSKLMSRFGETEYHQKELVVGLDQVRAEPSKNLPPTEACKCDIAIHGSDKTRTSVAEGVKSSDISALGKLVSHELFEELARRPGVDVPSLERRIVAGVTVELEIVITRQLAKLQNRLDEIDSVGKQSALLLARLEPSQTAPLTLTVNSTSTSIANSSLPLTTSPVGQLAQNSRWFPGSKVPGKLAEQQLAAPVSSSAQRSSCLSKTSLIRPTSCRQWRLAGANCSGQYYIFERGAIKHVYCDMNMDREDQGGGWTLILRRLDKSLTQQAKQSGNLDQPEGRKANQLLEAVRLAQVNFNQDWSNYKLGFGELSSWGEFFIGLNSLYILSNDEQPDGSGAPLELQLDLETNRAHQLHLRFSSFQVANETLGFRLDLGDCKASSPTPTSIGSAPSRLVCEPMSKLNGSQFYTHDRATIDSCPRPYGWWVGAPEATQCDSNPAGSGALTAPIGRDRHLFWPHWEHASEPIRKLVLKVRRLERSAS